ncbi:YdcF family protein [Candidatus Nomurabacteria bacterium]|nr:YdcF family protein [Candidatus Nomurabacteria bacterium]
MDIIDTYAKKIWDYMKMNQPLEKADAIFVLGSSDIRTAERAAELWHQGFAPYIIFSGKHGKEPFFKKTEAEVLADRACEVGVPREVMILEMEARSTGDNIIFTKKLLAQKGFNFKSFILIQKPYMERRTYATFAKQWPGVDFIVTSPQIPYEEYAHDAIKKQHFIEGMVGDLQRIREYPKLGFQIEQDIPDDIWSAYEKLTALGYTRRCIQ